MCGTIVKVFMGGDVYGEPGLAVLASCFPDFRRREGVDFAVINGENAADGFGILEREAEKIFASGIDVITGGNHIFEKRDVYPYLNSEKRLLRPANYADDISLPDGSGIIPGRGLDFYDAAGVVFAVLNIQGRESMIPVDCPFRYAQKAVFEAAERGAIVLVDFHAESNEEKEAMGIFLDGKAAAVCGTHTHVQTGDERILPHGTAYITDLGMTGPVNSVIGTKPEVTIKRNISQILYKMETADGPASIQGVLVGIDIETRRALYITPVTIEPPAGD